MIRRQPPQILEFANATRRGAYTTLTLNDLGALGLDRDTGLSWRLTAVAPSIEWTPFGDGGGSSAMPLGLQAEVTDNLSLTSTTPIPLLDGDGGSPIELAFDVQPAGTKAMIFIGGGMFNGDPDEGGGTERVYVQPVINGVPLVDSNEDPEVASAHCDGGGVRALLGGPMLAELDPDAEANSITFQIWTFGGNLVSCYPNDADYLYLRSRIRVGVILCS